MPESNMSFDPTIVESEGAPMDLAKADENQDKETRITTKFITKYERARVLGVRATQIRFLSLFRN